MLSIATTRLIPLHTGKGRTVGQAVSDIIDYAENPEKTNNGKLISSYQCDSRIADAEFLFSKRQYLARTGRQRGADDVIAYQIRQSFVPGEITPEEANRLGYELARRFTKGNHAFIVCTHAAIKRYYLCSERLLYRGRSQTPGQELQQVAGQQAAQPPGPAPHGD